MNFYGGNQFKFVECNSLYESKAKVRSCAQFADKTNFITLQIEKFLVQAAISSQTKTLIEFERLFIDYCFKRTEGLMWKDEKSYNLPLLRIDRPLRVLLHVGEDYLRVKLNHLELTATFTDQIFKLSESFSQASKTIEKSGWKRVYATQSKVSKNRMILLIVPSGIQGRSSKVTLSVQLKSNKILTDRILHIKRLAFHEPECNSARISQIIKDWVMDILKDNMGTLVTGAFSEVICKCV